MIRIKRVGNISMGLVLIAFGAALFMSQFSNFSALKAARLMWPAILILLGAEILWCRYASKEEESVIKYDLFSIFIVLIILFANMALYAAEETGVMDRMQRMFLSEYYSMDVMLNEYVTDDSINKIIIDDTNNIVVRASDDNKISGISDISIYAASKKEAEELSSSEHVSYRRNGDTLYIYPVSCTDSRYNYSSHNNIEIFIPKNIDVEVVNCGNLDLIYENFGNEWTLDSVRNVNIRLDKPSNVKVNAFVESTDELRGNASWLLKESGKYVNGEGSNAINILNSGNITVNEV
ncbi:MULTISPECIES: LiaI-LiaF-like domain-containing protein [unclassified Sedimentibacter]|uniref:LiaI-LiaF-like domain-containing protein n=1 Tax=unclassified Sedimentibacter TaxID=2649220 RepID=UPI0027E1DFAE|nr:DUF5668 domain-containing protein [Sedimentibacter sp. MB35-C1]WMJ76338.1 DUF5668 domain-containing protein [Sedimentibacter sp. MB35-C1]